MPSGVSCVALLFRLLTSQRDYTVTYFLPVATLFRRTGVVLVALSWGVVCCLCVVAEGAEAVVDG